MPTTITGLKVEALDAIADEIKRDVGESVEQIEEARDQAVAAAQGTDADAQATEAGRQQAVQAAGDAAAARQAAEAARLLAEQERQAAEAAAVAAALRAGYYDTIAAGRAAVADGESFAVRAGGADGLARPTIYRRDSATTQTAMVTIVTPSEVDEISARAPALLPIQDGGFAVVDSNGVRYWLGANGEDGGPDDYARSHIMSAAMVSTPEGALVEQTEPLWMVQDGSGVITDFALRGTDGQVYDYVLRRWFGRAQSMGLISQGSQTLRANTLPARFTWSQARGLTRHLAGTQRVADVTDTTLRDQPTRLRVPIAYRDDHPVPLVLVCEGTGRFDEPGGYDPRGGLSAVPDACGVAWVQCRLHGNSYGNADCMQDLRAVYEWVTSQIAVSSVILFGNSMGGVAACNALTRNVIPGVIGLYLTDPAIDLYQRFAAGSAGAMANVRSAYGISNDIQYAALTAGFDPMLADWTAWRGMPVTILGGPQDGTVPFALHGQALAAKLDGHNDVDVIEMPFGHGASNRFEAAPMIAFIEKVCGGSVVY